MMVLIEGWTHYVDKARISTYTTIEGDKYIFIDTLDQLQPIVDALNNEHLELIWCKDGKPILFIVSPYDHRDD